MLPKEEAFAVGRKKLVSGNGEVCAHGAGIPDTAS